MLVCISARMRTHALTHSRRTVRSSVLLLKEKPFEAYVIVFDKIVSNYPQISNYEIYWVVFARTLEFEPNIYIYIREITMHAFARVLFWCLFFIRLCFFLQALFYPFCLNVRISWTKPSVKRFCVLISHWYFETLGRTQTQ